jgi:hypothetical protein
MPSVMGLLEEREAAARVRAEELRVEVERIAAELADAEAVLERRVIARTELAEALAAGGEETQASAAGVREAPAVTEKAPAPVVGSVVPRWHEAATADVLAVDYPRIVELVESGAGDGEGISTKQLARRASAGAGTREGRGGAVQGEAAGRAGLADGVAVGPVHAAAAHRSCASRRPEACRARRRLRSMACDK